LGPGANRAASAASRVRRSVWDHGVHISLRPDRTSRLPRPYCTCVAVVMGPTGATPVAVAVVDPVSTPFRPGFTATFSVVRPPAGSAPTVQLAAVPVSVHRGSAEAGVILSENVVCSATPAASTPPRLRTVIWYVRVLRTFTGSGVSTTSIVNTG